MSDDAHLPQPLRSTYDAGLALRDEIRKHLAAWPRENDRALRGNELPGEYDRQTDELRDRTHRWFNILTFDVLPFTAYDRTYLSTLLRHVNAAIKGARFYQEYHPPEMPANALFLGPTDTSPLYNVDVATSPEEASANAHHYMNEALRIVRTTHVSAAADSRQLPTAHYVPNSAFILMWMDRARPELVDVHQAVKETFAEFGIRAFRADEVQHQDRITDLILNQIAQAEFLFADLSGERPNVYYEVGYAHALGKRPILYRRAKTALHFDLSVHNVPEYQNITELRALLRERLASVTGREPRAKRDG